MGFGVGVTPGWGLIGLSGLESFFLVKTMASVIMIASTMTVTTTTAMMSRRLFGLKSGRRHRSQFNAYTF